MRLHEHLSASQWRPRLGNPIYGFAARQPTAARQNAPA